jgi:hypothetical protein
MIPGQANVAGGIYLTQRTLQLLLHTRMCSKLAGVGKMFANVVDKNGCGFFNLKDKLHKENPTRCQPQCIRICISYLHEAQHVSGDTPPIISH